MDKNTSDLYHVLKMSNPTRSIEPDSNAPKRKLLRLGHHAPETLTHSQSLVCPFHYCQSLFILAYRHLIKEMTSPLHASSSHLRKHPQIFFLFYSFLQIICKYCHLINFVDSTSLHSCSIADVLLTVEVENATESSRPRHRCPSLCQMLYLMCQRNGVCILFGLGPGQRCLA